MDANSKFALLHGDLAYLGDKMRQEDFERLFINQSNGWYVGLERALPNCDLLVDSWPAESRIFFAFELVPPEDINYIILGQDPYYSTSKVDNISPIATGLAFGVDKELDIAPSLRRILLQVYPNGYGVGKCNLVEWAMKKKILLLNSALTIPRPNELTHAKKCAGAHISKWRPFTVSILRYIKSVNPQVTMVAWGSEPRKTMYAAFGQSPEVEAMCWDHPVARRGGARSFGNFWMAHLNRLTLG